MTIHIGTARPREDPDALILCWAGGKAGDEERRAVWADLGPPPARMWSQRKHKLLEREVA